MPLKPALKGQTYLCKFKASLVYGASSGIARAITQRNPVWGVGGELITKNKQTKTRLIAIYLSPRAVLLYQQFLEFSISLLLLATH